ncbi:hypothetical protein [Clostridium sp.]|uniref:hypothetical protein n=1 Tax=Clostridium sp. TaxID=1506 RepID=UPI00321751A2
MSESKNEKEQLVAIESLLKDNDYKYDRINFQLLTITDNTIVIKNFEYNRLSSVKQAFLCSSMSKVLIRLILAARAKL